RVFDPRIILQQVGVLVDIGDRRNKSVALSGDTDKVGAAAIDLLHAGPHNATERFLLLRQSPAKIDLGKRYPALAAERANLRKNLLDQMLPLFLQIEEGGGDEEAEFVP